MQNYRTLHSDDQRVVSKDDESKDEHIVMLKLYDRISISSWWPIRACLCRRGTSYNVGGFDQANFDGWHFYVVDFTLRAEL